MCSILLHFQIHPSSDIEKAFLNVQFHEDDRDCTRFLWLSQPDDPESVFQTYQFKVVLFCATCSPLMFSSALESPLDQYSSKIATDMKEYIYVDNLISVQPTENDVTHYYKSARSIMSSGNFNLRAWASNSPQLKCHCLQEGTADAKTTASVLGLRWNTLTDTWPLTPKHMSSSLNLPTKREVLSNSSKIYDPQGLLSPVTIRAKLHMQELWLQKIKWDEPLSQELSEKWLSIADDINTVSATMNFLMSHHNQS
jgi:hypothetical protein